VVGARAADNRYTGWRLLDGGSLVPVDLPPVRGSAPIGFVAGIGGCGAEIRLQHRPPEAPERIRQESAVMMVKTPEPVGTLELSMTVEAVMPEWKTMRPKNASISRSAELPRTEGGPGAGSSSAE